MKIRGYTLEEMKERGLLLISTNLKRKELGVADQEAFQKFVDRFKEGHYYVLREYKQFGSLKVVEVNLAGCQLLFQNKRGAYFKLYYYPAQRGRFSYLVRHVDMMLASCVVCKKPFRPFHQRSGRDKYCSSKCKSQADYAKKKAKRARLRTEKLALQVASTPS